MERSTLAAALSRYGAVGPAGTAFVDDVAPAAYMASVAGAIAADGNVFLGNPSWTAAERSEAEQATRGGPSGERGWLMIPSGGSGGAIKFARHDSWTLAAAVEGFRTHFDMECINAVSVLPLHHVSGFMAWMRCALTGGTFVPWAWRDIEAGLFPEQIPERCCISLVPTQLQRLMASETATAWLRRFAVIFVGGGPSWENLLETAAGHGLPLSPSYGATETAAMVAAVKPAAFLNGMRACGPPLPHAQIDVVDGIVRVAGESVFRGYFPDWTVGRSWTTQDLGMFDEKGSLVILGRRDDVILTGGKKVTPAEVESALRSSGQFEDLAVIGIADPDWGQAVVACYGPQLKPPAMERVAAALAALSAYKHPKTYLALSSWPRNPQGKMDRSALARLAAASRQQSSP
jgi:o-succinylbenzoate---CoA ligase